ncbi:hypothetical protein L873DRAFT_1849504 [Choiromyces venosus 120613-1]|uniref:Uncharacterized protein n=1 Tax=Choiromyces venosus 120613-1 TaxID=1336337 RepID=A0A3N4IS94_9PEZI|nr:hypothetical protein L873DRAFT_1849504 [Choiromyces venosus 120613-1]
MWDQFCEKLDTAASHAGWTMIARQFNQSKPEPNQPIQKCLSRLLQFRRRLAGTEQAISDEAFSSHLISRLPATFNSLVDIILHQPEGYTVETLMAKIVEAEATAKNRSTEYTSLDMGITSSPALPNSGMSAQGRADSGRGNRSQRGRGKTKRD